MCECVGDMSKTKFVGYGYLLLYSGRPTGEMSHGLQNGHRSRPGGKILTANTRARAHARTRIDYDHASIYMANSANVT